MCDQCGLSVVGLERETERVIAAKRREHIDTCDDEEESYDLSAMSCDSPSDPRGPSHDTHTEVACSSLQCSSHLSTDWSLHLYHLLPLDLKRPFHVSTQLNIDATHRSTTKLCQLLLHLQRKFPPFSLRMLHRHRNPGRRGGGIQRSHGPPPTI